MKKMEFNVLKSGGLVKKYSPVIFTISEDEFYYKKSKSDEKYQIYHINYLNEIYLQQQAKEKPEYILFLEINIKYMEEKKKDKKTKTVKLATKDDKNTNILSDIKKILNVKRLQYDINLFLFNWKQVKCITFDKSQLIKPEDEEKRKDLKKNLIENIEKKTNKESIDVLFEYRLNNFIKYLNQLSLNIPLLDDELIKKIRGIINSSTILENEQNNNNKNFKISESIEQFNQIYLNFIKIYTQIKFGYILKRYKYYDKKYLLENQTINSNKNKNNEEIINSESLFNPNETKEEITIIHSNTYVHNNHNDNEIIKEDNIDLRISKKKEQNERIENRIIAGLNSNTKMKENLKNLILSQNKKLYLCIKCNSLIEKSLLDKANCNFDNSCTNRSFFYCRRCKLHLCTKCVIYQRGLKCSKNHKYFKKAINSEETKCFLCNKANNIPYYECKYCKEMICSDCSSGVVGRQNSCFNCNNELIWRKCIYTSCNRCQKLSDCFYYCVCCDYYVCLNCSSLPKNEMCGALHNLKEIDLMNSYCCTDKTDKEQIPRINDKYCFNYEVLFSGKCCWCNATIGKNKIWGCLRCSFFLCDNCNKRNSE